MFISRDLYEAFQRDARMLSELRQQLWDERVRYDTLLAEVLRRGLKDEKETPAQPEPERSLPVPIQQALGQWPEGSAPYVANLQYAHAQLAIRPDDAEGIAAEIKAGEDVEAWV